MNCIVRPTRGLVSVAVSLAAVLLVGCGTQDATGPERAGTVTPPAATTPAVGPDEPTQSLTGTLVLDSDPVSLPPTAIMADC